MVIVQGEKKREEKAARGHGGGVGAGQTNKIASHTNAFLTSNQVGMVTSMRAKFAYTGQFGTMETKIQIYLEIEPS